MKTNYTSLLRLPVIIIATMVSLIAFPVTADAKPKNKKNKHSAYSGNKHSSYSGNKNSSPSSSHYDRDRDDRSRT